MGRLASAALLLSVSLVLSRVLGLLRNVVIADIFGNSRATDAYFAAFRIPDTMFMLVSGGALVTAFVPTFAGLLEKGDEREAWRTASTVLNTLALVLAALAALAFLLAPFIMAALVSGFRPGERDLSVSLTRIMLLQPIFLGLAALLMAILQTYHRFLLTAIAPLVYNLFVILGALTLGSAYGVRALAWSVVIGALGQLVVLLPGLRAELLYRYRPALLAWDAPAAREVLRLFGPRIVGLAAFQVMLLVTLFLAASLPQGNVSAINYAWPLIMFPVGALGNAAATAIFPTLSRLSASQDYATLAGSVNRGLRLILFFALPASVGLLVLRRPIINLLFNHGQWTHRATEQTAFALLFFALAVAPLSAVELLARAFYAMRDTVRPVRVAIVAVIVDVGLSILLVHTLPPASGQGGLALATAAASAVQAIWLALALERRLGTIGRKGLLLTVRDAGIASLVMGMVLYLALSLVTSLFAQHGFGALMTVLIELCLGFGAFFGTAYVLGAPELWQVQSFFVRQK